MTIADDFQYLLCPIAFTTEATQEGPLSVYTPLICSYGWSEFAASGATHATFGSFPLLISENMTFGLFVTLVCHSLPCRTASIASKALQIPGPPLLTATA